MKKIICIAISSIIVHFSIGQGIGVGTNTPNPSAALDVTSVTQGMLVPRMTTAQRITIANAANGLLVFDISTETFWFYNDGWLELIDSAHKEVYRSAPDKIYAGMTDKVGLGISNPLNKLDIDATANRSGSHATQRPLYVTGDILESSNGIEFRHSNGTQGIGFGFNTMYATGSAADQDLGLASKGAIGSLVFQTNGLERMRINGGGNVGIGVSVPLATLDVARGSAIDGALIVRGTTHLTHFNYGGDEHTYLRGGKVGSHVILNDVSGLGNIGIGTGNPLQKLHIEGSTFISQNLGIGTSSPNAQIQLASTVANRKVVLYDELNNDNQYFGLGINPYTMRYQVSGPESNHIFYAGTSPNTSNELLRITGSGNVGIGTGSPVQKLHVEGNTYISQKLGIGNSAPNAQIQLASTVANRKVVLYEVANNDHQFFGFGVNGDGTLRYQTPVTANDHAFYAGTSATTSNELMRIRGNGNVKVAGWLELGYVHVSNSVVIGAGSAGNVTCNCPAGTQVTGGGAYCNYSNYFELTASFPSSSTSWYAGGNNIGSVEKILTAYAICARIAN